eukprot:2399729-Rhodomonas_salina.1
MLGGHQEAKLEMWYPGRMRGMTERCSFACSVNWYTHPASPHPRPRSVRSVPLTSPTLSQHVSLCSAVLRCAQSRSVPLSPAPSRGALARPLRSRNLRGQSAGKECGGGRETRGVAEVGVDADEHDARVEERLLLVVRDQRRHLDLVVLRPRPAPLTSSAFVLLRGTRPHSRLHASTPPHTFAACSTSTSTSTSSTSSTSTSSSGG